ncbi:MAG TPA: hypothetical protein VK771_03005, partial [Acidimicrobiia bacterium]|nr:hypothetical protein [Acidimicrobiia bacterium]
TGDDDASAQAKAHKRTLADDVLVGGPACLARHLARFVERGAAWIIAGPVDASNVENAANLGEMRHLLGR